MSIRRAPWFVASCDEPGCPERHTVVSTSATDVEAFLHSRGWSILAGHKHRCPTHARRQRALTRRKQP